MFIYYIRHGDPTYNPDCLTPLGIRQAEALGRRLALHGIDEIYSSPSVRAMQTATPLSEIIRKPINTLEFCFEDLAWQEFTVIGENGQRRWMFAEQSVKDKFSEKEIFELRNDWYKGPFFDKKVGEGVNRVNNAIDEFLAGFGYIHQRERGTYRIAEHNNKRIAIFAHEGFSMIFFSSLLDIPYPLFSTRFDISHSCVSVVELSYSASGETIPKVLQYSNDSHLYKDNLPTKYNNNFFV